MLSVRFTNVCRKIRKNKLYLTIQNTYQPVGNRRYKKSHPTEQTLRQAAAYDSIRYLLNSGYPTLSK